MHKIGASLILNWTEDKVSVWAAAAPVFQFLQATFTQTVSRTLEDAVGQILIRSETIYLTVISGLTLVIGASSIYLHVRAALYHMWRRVVPRPISLPGLS